MKMKHFLLVKFTIVLGLVACTTDTIRVSDPTEFAPTATSPSATHIQPSPSYSDAPSPYRLGEELTCTLSEHPTPPDFTGRILLTDRSNYSAYPTQTLKWWSETLWSISGSTLQLQDIGRYSNVDQQVQPHTVALSPNGRWLLLLSNRNLWKEPRPIQVTAVDLSDSFLINWEAEWDSILGWLDDDHIVVLPDNDKTTDILALNPFTGERYFLLPQATNRELDLGWNDTSKWGNVFFNHAFSQMLYLDFWRRNLYLSPVAGEPIWSLTPTYFDWRLKHVASWSPDDAMIAIAISSAERRGILLVDRLGQTSQITDFGNEYDNELVLFFRPRAWSPNSQRLVIEVAWVNSSTEISDGLFVLDLLHKELRPTCSLGNFAAFSPDSRYIVYEQTQLIETGPAVWKPELGILDIETGEQWRIKVPEDWNGKRLEVLGWLP